MNMKYKKPAFTLVELLTVLAIVAVLVGILVPSLNMVRNVARETKQKAQFAAIDQGILAFKSDYGDYPPSDYSNGTYFGAQKLAEALVGRDLLGFHPGSSWDALGTIYDMTGLSQIDIENNLSQRRGPYLELAGANAFTLEQLFDGEDPMGFGADSLNAFVLCDSFTVKKVAVSATVTLKAGNPVLYYRANTSKMTMMAGGNSYDQRYDSEDNFMLIAMKKAIDLTNDPLAVPPGNYFYSPEYKILDPKIPTTTLPGGWPHRPDSYILISAGVDGLYGTADDITNF